MVRASQTVDRLNGSEKAAISLLNLGEEMAGKVLGQMGQDEIQYLGNYMASIGTLSPDLARGVNEEFLRETVGSGSRGFAVGNVSSVRRGGVGEVLV